MSSEGEIREASDKFYAALNRMGNGDSTALGEVWAKGPEVSALHPIGGREIGWDAVRESFENVAQVASDGRIRLTDQLIRAAGDLGYEIGTESGEMKLGGHHVRFEHRVTNIYRREDGAWKMVHHHTDTSPAMLEVLKKLSP